MSVFVNRILNMKKIKAIGLDMDYTLVQYKTKNFEKLTHGQVLKSLIKHRHYPKEILELEFDYDMVIQGLVIDKSRGNLLQVSRYGKVKRAQHGLYSLSFKEQNEIYANTVIDLSDENIQSLDTAFSVSNGVLFSQLVELKSKGLELPAFDILAIHIKEMLDYCHSDGSLKDVVRANISDYIVQDPDLVKYLELYKRYGKKLLIITNSDFHYSKLLLEYAIDPFLKEHESWQELFDITITLSSKPSFFHNRSSFLRVDPINGLMSNHDGKITKGVYQGGYAGKLQEDLGLTGDEILYIGDHIYGDVLALKKTFAWQTALVIEPLQSELAAIESSRSIQKRIDQNMRIKEKEERALREYEMKNFLGESDEKICKEKINLIFSKIEKVNSQISEDLDKYRAFFNPNWGELMRAGQEESRFADQIEKYANVYIPSVSALFKHSPRTYFRPMKRPLAHEI